MLTLAPRVTWLCGCVVVPSNPRELSSVAEVAAALTFGSVDDRICCSTCSARTMLVAAIATVGFRSMARLTASSNSTRAIDWARAGDASTATRTAAIAMDLRMRHLRVVDMPLLLPARCNRANRDIENWNEDDRQER